MNHESINIEDITGFEVPSLTADSFTDEEFAAALLQIAKIDEDKKNVIMLFGVAYDCSNLFCAVESIVNAFRTKEKRKFFIITLLMVGSGNVAYNEDLI
jgi:hypothetical protein